MGARKRKRTAERRHRPNHAAVIHQEIAFAERLVADLQYKPLGINIAAEEARLRARITGLRMQLGTRD